MRTRRWWGTGAEGGYGGGEGKAGWILVVLAARGVGPGFHGLGRILVRCL